MRTVRCITSGLVHTGELVAVRRVRDLFGRPKAHEVQYVIRDAATGRTIVGEPEWEATR